MIRTALVLSLVAGAAGAATPPVEQIPGAGWERPEPPAPPSEQLFISPAGEPFRAPLDEPYPVVAWFAAADANHDGALDMAEFEADHLRFFARLDTNGDGVIDGFESGAYEQTVAPELSEVFDARPGRNADKRRRGWRLFGGKPPRRHGSLQGAAPYALINEPMPVRGADRNFDYRISRQEQIAAAADRFARLDVNKDGRLEPAELKKTPLQTRLTAAPR